MMKFRLLLAVSLLVSMQSLTHVEAATPTPGAPCVKSGQLVRSGSKSYICLKSGKKLIWSKGTKLVTPSASPTPAVSPSPTPGTAQSPTEGQSEKSEPTSLQFDSSKPQENQKCDPSIPSPIGYESDLHTLVYLSCGPDGKWHPSINAPSIDQSTGLPAGDAIPKFTSNNPYDKVFENAFNALWGLSPNPYLGTPSTDMEASIPNTVQQTIMDGLNTALNKFGGYVQNSEFKIIVAEDAEYAKEVVQKWMTEKSVLQNQNSQIVNSSIDYMVPLALNQGEIQAFGIPLVGNTGEQLGLIIYIVPPGYQLSNNRNPRINAIGEVLITIANILSGGTARPTLPSWIPEGFEGLGVDVYGPSVKSETQSWGMYFSSSPTNESVSHDLNFYSENPGWDFAQYGVARLAVAYLLSQYGADKFLSFLQEVSQNSNWQSDFQSTFGLSFDAFNQNVGGYLDWWMSSGASGALGYNQYG